MASKLPTEEAKHVGRWSRGHTSLVRQGAQGMLLREIVSFQAMLTSEYISTLDMWTRESRKHVRHSGMQARDHTKHIGTWAPKHLSTQDTLIRKHVSTQGMLAVSKCTRKARWHLSTILARMARSSADLRNIKTLRYMFSETKNMYLLSEGIRKNVFRKTFVHLRQIRKWILCNL